MSRNFNGNIGTKINTIQIQLNYPPKFLVQFEAKYLPQIAPEAVSEHEYAKFFLGGGGGGGGHAPRPP